MSRMKIYVLEDIEDYYLSIYTVFKITDTDGSSFSEGHAE